MADEEGEKTGEPYRPWDESELRPGGDLAHCDLRQANLGGANLGGANLRQANLWGVNLEVANLTKANLEGANLREANLEGANLEGTNLREANLWRANLREANLIRANLREANLRAAKLWRANLREANLEGVNLRGVNLREANLWRANLREANLREADLEGANLRGASLEEVLPGLTQAQLDAAMGDHTTTIPPDLRYPDHWPPAPSDDSDAMEGLQQRLAASSPIGFVLGDDDKIRHKDTPIDVAPPEDNPRKLQDLLQAIPSLLDDLENDLVGARGRNYDLEFLIKQCARYKEALVGRENLSWYELEGKIALIRSKMQREDAENTWNEDIVQALNNIMGLHGKLEKLIRPEQPQNPEQPPEIDQRKVVESGLSEELQQHITDFANSPETKDAFHPETRSLFQEQAADAQDPDNKHNKVFTTSLAQTFASLGDGLVKWKNIIRDFVQIHAMVERIWKLLQDFFPL